MPLGFIDGLEDSSSPASYGSCTRVAARNGFGMQWNVQGGYIDYGHRLVPPSKSMTVGFAWRPIDFRDSDPCDLYDSGRREHGR